MSTPTFQHVLVIGATSGLGEQFARRYHAQGKMVIATGRRAERLEKLKQELPGLATYRFDAADLTALQSSVKQILADHPTVDTVIMMSGIMNLLLFQDPSLTSVEKITAEAQLNFVAPMVLSQLLVPHFAQIKTPTNIILVSSGLAYIPFALFPVYNATKAGIHTFACSLRGQTADTPINIIELAPPHVDTDLDKHTQGLARSILGDKARPPTPLDVYMDDAIKKLEVRVDGKPLKEITLGFSELGNSAWRNAYDPIFKQFGMEAV